MTTELHSQRLDAVLDAVRLSGARSVLDLGCGDGAFLMRLLGVREIERVVGIDLSAASLRVLRRRLHGVPMHVAEKVKLIQGSMTEQGQAIAGFDAAVIIEAIEHIDPDRLSGIEQAVFSDLAPPTVIVTTPNADFNTLLGVPHHRFRHSDHRFEWGRAKFRAWADGVARRNRYAAELSDIAGVHPRYGGASQMAIFRSLPNGRTGGQLIPGLERETTHSRG